MTAFSAANIALSIYNVAWFIVVQTLIVFRVRPPTDRISVVFAAWIIPAVIVYTLVYRSAS